MTTYYLNSASASEASPYDTRAKAAHSIASLTLAAGDIVYADDGHSEQIAATTTLLSAGTATAPVRIYSVDFASGEPPTTLSAGASIEITGASHNLTLLGGSTNHCYFYGFNFTTGASQSTSCGITTGVFSYCEACNFSTLSTYNSGAQTTVSTNAIAKNCGFKGGAASQPISVQANSRIIGGSVLSGGTSPTNLFLCTASSEIAHFDLSNCATTVTLASLTTAGAITRMVKCKTPASWAGGYAASGVVGVGEFINCGNAAGNTGYVRVTPYGTVSTETTLVMTGGATDGTTPVSRKMVSLTASGMFPHAALDTAEFAVWNDTVGSPMTKTIEFLHDSATGLKDNEFYFTVRYPADTGDPLGGLATTAPDALAAGSTLTTSSETWTTTGMSNPNAQKATTGSFTPQQKGYLYYRVHLAKSNYTVYFNPPAA